LILFLCFIKMQNKKIGQSGPNYPGGPNHPV
jgi:hypothetical protein